MLHKRKRNTDTHKTTTAPEQQNTEVEVNENVSRLIKTTYSSCSNVNRTRYNTRVGLSSLPLPPTIQSTMTMMTMTTTTTTTYLPLAPLLIRTKPRIVIKH